MTKPTKWPVCPAKTQTNLGIRPVWSERLLSVWRNHGHLASHWAHSEDSDQIWRMPRLVWVFAGRTGHFVGFVMRQLIYLWLTWTKKGKKERPWCIFKLKKWHFWKHDKIFKLIYFLCFVSGSLIILNYLCHNLSSNLVNPGGSMLSALWEILIKTVQLHNIVKPPWKGDSVFIVASKCPVILNIKK